MSRTINRTNLSFDITKASHEEIEHISKQVIKTLAERAKLENVGDLASSHDRHYSTHSSAAALSNPESIRDTLIRTPR